MVSNFPFCWVFKHVFFSEEVFSKATCFDIVGAPNQVEIEKSIGLGKGSLEVVDLYCAPIMFYYDRTFLGEHSQVAETIMKLLFSLFLRAMLPAQALKMVIFVHPLCWDIFFATMISSLAHAHEILIKHS